VSTATEPMRPFGHVVYASAGTRVDSLPIQGLRDLALEHRVLVLRGFDRLEASELVEYCRSWGDLLEWDFGVMLDVVEHSNPTNYIFTHGNVPYHWDGAFAAQVPSFQVFQCLQTGPRNSGGETLFADTIRIVENLDPEVRELWRTITIRYTTEKVVHYGGRIEAPLLGLHPLLRRETLRFAEPFDEGTVRLNELELEVFGVHAEGAAELISDLRKLLYDPANCYAHAWRVGDIVIADNHALLHGRRAYATDTRRHLQRVHVL
jgi:alpha-ketoglutarate-dependent taurine dioxygenase